MAKKKKHDDGSVQLTIFQTITKKQEAKEPKRPVSQPKPKPPETPLETQDSQNTQYEILSAPFTQAQMLKRGVSRRAAMKANHGDYVVGKDGQKWKRLRNYELPMYCKPNFKYFAKVIQEAP